MHLARKKLEKELNIIEMVKSRRYMYAAVRTLIPNEKERLILKEKSRYIAINPDKD